MTVYITQTCDMCTQRRQIEVGPYPDSIESAMRSYGWEKIMNVFPREHLKNTGGSYTGSKDNDPVICPKCHSALRMFINNYAMNQDDGYETRLTARSSVKLEKGERFITTNLFLENQALPIGEISITARGKIVGAYESSTWFEHLYARISRMEPEGLFLGWRKL